MKQQLVEGEEETEDAALGLGEIRIVGIVDVDGGSRGIGRTVALKADRLKIAVDVAPVAGHLREHELVGIFAAIRLAWSEFALFVTERHVVRFFSGGGEVSTALVEDAPNAGYPGTLVAIVCDPCVVRR